MDAAIIATLISAFIALIGVIVSVVISRQQVKSQLEVLRQSQYTEILKKRIDAYPKLWKIVMIYTSNWNIQGKPHDKKWVSEFLSAINECHAEIGVYFSQSVYEKFHELRTKLVQLDQKAELNNQITREDTEGVGVIFSGDSHTTGLATHLKNDLGSYGYTAIGER